MTAQDIANRLITQVGKEGAFSPVLKAKFLALCDRMKVPSERVIVLLPDDLRKEFS